MVRHCPDCELDMPDGLNVGDGLRGVKYCPFCGTEVER